MKILLIIPYRGIGDLIFHIPLIRGLYKKYNSNVHYSGKIFSNSFFNESYHKISANAILSSSNSLINLYPEFETYEIRDKQ